MKKKPEKLFFSLSFDLFPMNNWRKQKKKCEDEKYDTNVLRFSANIFLSSRCEKKRNF